MKHIYSVTRPTWAAMEKSETAMILIATLMLALYAGWGEQLATHLLIPFRLPEDLVHRSWRLIDPCVVTLFCLVLIRIYQRLRIRFYPSTFIYCFDIPEASNPSGKSQVVGYCHIKPNTSKGEILAEGASFFWEDGRLGQRTVFTSTLVRAIQDKDEIICCIQFDINKEDRPKRLYSHGVLQFQLVTHSNCTTSNDVYAGYLQSYNKEVELQDVDIHARGYAEWHSKGRVLDNSIRFALQENGELLLAKLKALLNDRPLPTLWLTKDPMSPGRINCWGNHIPTPQSVILKESLSASINKYLTKVLSLFGLDESAIKRFQATAVHLAQQDETLVGYEYQLKRELAGQVKMRGESNALVERAKIIYDEIMDSLIGDSLLDIGCGNGFISNLAKAHFKQIQLLDVVEYVHDALDLPFKRYAEGQPLPIDKLFDTVLLLTVLHHSNDPVELLKQAWRATNKRLIIIESVVGIRQVCPPAHYELMDSSDEDQIAYAAFVDWFYNRVLHDDVPVPYNFTTPEKWQAIFLENGMRLKRATHFGQDIEIGPEYHILFVLDKE